MTKKPGKKSIAANFGAMSFEAPSIPKENASRTPSPTHGIKPKSRMAAGVVAATQRSISDIRVERDRLRSMVELGSGYIEIDPDLIDPSPFPDRLPDDSEDDFLEFIKSIEQEGQTVPIQVRKHPDKDKRFEVVYGHRRWRAAKELDVDVKAFVVELTDRELVVAQGIENGNRQDLTWIERALFAWRMEKTDIKARDIRAALSVDDAELSKYRLVSRALPVDVIETIGRAPKVGRPRWLELAKLIGAKSSGVKIVRKTLSADKVLELSSDGRFSQVLACLKKDDGPSKDEKLVLTHPVYGSLGTAVFATNQIKLQIDEVHASGFSVFLEKELPSLVERYFTKLKDGST